MHLGKAIKNLRVLASYSQQQIADKIGKTKGLICQIEKTGKVNYYTLQRIAEILQTTPANIELYAKTLNPHLKPRVDNSISNGDLPHNELLKLENQLLKEQIAHLKKIILLLEVKIK
jgi:transcriptional regulator with XRE-family HTH domain